MKALLSKQAGGPSTLVLEDVPEPTAGPGEVLVAVKVCAVNYPDVLMIEDRYQIKPPRPFAVGGEVAGVVEAVGAGVTSVKPGDHVMALCMSGGMAEKVVVSATLCIPFPANMPFDEASALLITYGTSIHALIDRGRLKKGETLLVLGAAGGVGMAAVELGKAYGARVIAGVSSPDKLAFIKEHGADDGFVYPRGPFDKDGLRALTALFKEACGEKGPDVVYDPVGGAYAESAIRTIARGGRHLIVGFTAGIAKLPLNLPLNRSCDVVGVSAGYLARAHPEDYVANVRELIKLYAKGAIKPLISERFPLARGAEAITALAARKAVGKVVVTIN